MHSLELFTINLLFIWVGTRAAIFTTLCSLSYTSSFSPVFFSPVFPSQNRILSFLSTCASFSLSYNSEARREVEMDQPKQSE